MSEDHDLLSPEQHFTAEVWDTFAWLLAEARWWAAQELCDWLGPEWPEGPDWVPQWVKDL